MKLYFARHGDAVTKVEDSLRPLSSAGRETTIKMAKLLMNKGLELTQIFHSPKLRAKQTAEIYAEFLIGDKENITEVDFLSPDFAIDSSMVAIKESMHSAMFVGHLPSLELISSNLLTDNFMPILTLNVSSVLCIQKDNNSYVLNWLVDSSLVA